MHVSRKLLIGAGLFLLGIVASATWWRIDSERTPHFDEPRPTALPSPNAFDLLVQAAEAIPDKRAINDAVSGRRDPETGEFHDLSIEEKRGVLEASRDALGILRQAFEHPFVYPAVHDAINSGDSRFGDFRMLARLLDLEAEIYLADNRPGRAMAAALDCIELGRMVADDGVLIGTLTGIAISGIGRHRTPEMMDSLNLEELNDAIRRLESQRERRLDMTAVIRRERWFGLKQLEVLFAQDGWRLELAKMDQMEDAMDFEAMFMEWDDHPLRQRLQMRLRSWRYHKGRLVKAYDGTITQIERALQETYADSRDPWPDSDPRLPSIIDNSLTELFRNAWFSVLADETSQELLLAVLALEAHRKQTGNYPERLENLIGSRLQTLPRDPFTADETLRYRREADSYLLYSVGPDGLDHGGRPMERTEGRADLRFRPQPELDGDIVAGVNVLQAR